VVVDILSIVLTFFLWMLIKPASVTLNASNISFSNLGKVRAHDWNEISNLGYRTVGKLGGRTHFMTADKDVKGKVKNIMLGQFDVKMKQDEFLAMVIVLSTCHCSAAHRVTTVLCFARP